MTLRYVGQQQPCTVTHLPNPVADFQAHRAAKRDAATKRAKAADELRLLSERDPEFTNPDTEARLRAALPHLDDESRQLTWELLVACQDALRKHDGDPHTEAEYVDQLERLIRDALDDDAEAAGR